MRILFTSGRGWLPQTSGGVQASTTQLAGQLVERGNQVAILCRLMLGGRTAFTSKLVRKLGRTRFSRDTGTGFPVYRGWDPSDTTEVVERFRPDVAAVQSGNTMEIARSLADNNVPVVFYYRHVEFRDIGGDPTSIAGARHIANSRFTAEAYKEKFGLDATVIPPLVERSKYLTLPRRENVTMINPYPEKGIETALAIAGECPDIPFSLQESWRIEAELDQWLAGKLADLPNVSLSRRTDDMKSVYRKAKIVLAPSRWSEAWGRVATEAQFSGIPVLGSKQGGLPEAVGPGGVTIDVNDPLETWVSALRHMWDDQDYYAQLQDAALAHAKRSQINPDHQIATLINILKEAIDAQV